ncbi:MAG TPA: ATP synthase F1 subunit epsilon [Oligoflexus sp.]|uniref:ATP synthase F1 subunit epsilon n=1 Tax=Oligoflexus sp. TaxID=1971216 RepID=UPI002D7EC0BB|nr:ATP synthase F1 subunit epsilon [Oligoflexus sp.]HET9238869.1 ATP synthase F1 subunit epsilon [Oligoflexus sp.]
MAANFDLKVLSPSRAVATVKASAVTLPGTLGYMTILPDHAGMVAELDQGEVTITTADNAVERFFIAGGYVEVESNRVTLLADVIERAGEIDVARAQTARKRAAERLANIGPDTDLERANRALRRADQRIQMSQSTLKH